MIIANSKHYTHKIFNTGQDISRAIYKFFRRQWLRNIILLMVVISIAITFFSIGKAWPSEPSKKNPENIKSSQVSYKRYKERSDWISTTTTSTTTSPPVKKKQVPPAVTQPVRQVATTQSLPAGTWIDQCKVWATQAGIELTPDALWMIDHESDCSPTVYNPSSSAGGIPQALPASKMGCAMDASGAVCQLKWMHGYVFGRYGGWSQAKAAWISRAKSCRNGTDFCGGWY